MKISVDEISLKINFLRRISRVLMIYSEFWLRSIHKLELNYGDMDLFSFRELNYDRMQAVLADTKLSELTIQACFALRELRGTDDAQLMINPNCGRNYTLSEISYFSECYNFVYAYTEKYHDAISLKKYDTMG